MNKNLRKSGLIEFRTQQEIIAKRKQKTDQAYKELQERVKKIMNTIKRF